MKSKFVLLLFLCSLSLISCSTFFGPESRRGVSSSLVDYLYPDGQIPPKFNESVPHLQLPISVGLAFVPATRTYMQSLSEVQKIKLLEQVKQRFSNLEYVKDIIIVPETYMKSGKGFEGVGQIARLYGLDVVALVSYDQVATTADTRSSILYWTIVGAYFIEGSNNQATTFVDTAVFDIKSQKMLFRAAGVSDIQQNSTLVEVEKTNRDTRERGFELAMQNMSDNLALELDRFRERIKQDKSVQISHRQGYGGGGAVTWPLILILLVGSLLFRLAKPKR